MAYSTRFELLNYFKTDKLYTHLPVDIMVRTSGEIRLSDYMIEHCKSAMISFVDVYWPDFGIELFYILWKWQFYQKVEIMSNRAKIKT